MQLSFLLIFSCTCTYYMRCRLQSRSCVSYESFSVLLTPSMFLRRQNTKQTNRQNLINIKLWWINDSSAIYSNIPIVYGTVRVLKQRCVKISPVSPFSGINTGIHRSVSWRLAKLRKVIYKKEKSTWSKIIGLYWKSKVELSLAVNATQPSRQT